MPHESAASAGVISEQAPAESVSTAVEQPQPETQTGNTSITDILRERLPAEVREQLDKIRVPEQPETPEEETPAAEAEPVVESPETPPEEPPSEEQPEAHGDWPDSAKERVARLTKQKTKAKEAIEALEAERDQLRETLEQTQPVTVAPHSGDPLANIQDEQQLGQVVAEAKLVRDFYRARLQGYTENEGKEGERFVTPEEVALNLGQAEDVINEAVPRKRAEFQERRKFNAIAEQKYPQLFDKGSEDYQKLAFVFRRFPSLATDPAGILMAGHYLRGAKASLEEELAAGKKVNANIPPELKRQIPPIAPHVPAAQRGGDNKTPVRKKMSEAMNRVAQTGSPEDRIAAIRMALEEESKQRDSRSLVSV